MGQELLKEGFLFFKMDGTKTSTHSSSLTGMCGIRTRILYLESDRPGLKTSVASSLPSCVTLEKDLNVSVSIFGKFVLMASNRSQFDVNLAKEKKRVY